MRAPAPSSSVSTPSSSNRPRSRGAPTAKCCSPRPAATEYISGVILYDETIRQKTKDGVPFPALPGQHNMIPGIKVDTGAKPLAGFAGETITEGLDGLRERLAEYHALGARFAKWRAVIDIGSGVPSGLRDRRQRRSAGALCGALPGSGHRADRRARGADGRRSFDRALRGGHRTPCCRRVFDHLFAARIVLEGIVLKPNMVIAGKKSAQKATPEQVAEATLRTLEAARSVGGSGHRVSVRRSEPGRGDAAPEPDECGRAAAVGADLQLRTRAAGRRRSRPGAGTRGPPGGAAAAALVAREAERPGRGGVPIRPRWKAQRH